ncbi:TrmB family transcriptional regulator [Natronobiforma cellulositropha]|uniref:TrmB family transcriptional regulator n=1 Tax=Natronobiforma cellulositropha TaxID=1679076 RepID=UPI0021D5E067|nr:TrmB family transcriptional regulator [Natronobiforma cellulositropha]
MPISIDSFDEYDAPEQSGTNAEKIVRFLAENQDKAFKATEIAAATGVNENSVPPVLTRLRSRNLVRHKEPYWAIGDPAHVREAFALQSTTAVLDERLGDEDRAQWLEAGAESTDQ